MQQVMTLQTEVYNVTCMFITVKSVNELLLPDSIRFAHMYCTCWFADIEKLQLYQCWKHASTDQSTDHCNIIHLFPAVNYFGG